MAEEKVIQVIVPENLKDPISFDLWRPRIDDENNLILDFAKKESENEYLLVSSILIEKHKIDNFINDFLYKIYAINKKHNLGISLFENVKSNIETGKERE